MTKISAYQRLSRTPMLRRKESSGAKDIPDSPDGVNHRLRLVFIDFAAQPMHKHIYNVGLRIEAIIENVLKDHCLGDRTIGVAHEIFEHGEFARLQLDLLTAALHLAADQIERE